MNNIIEFPKFKYEDLKVASQHLEKDFYFSTFDLKSGYHHISIQEQDRTFLGFSWTYGNGLTKFYQFLVLPFGLASACYVFTKVLKPLIKKWRKNGIKITLYLDDGILCAQSYSLTKFQAGLVQNDLRNAGFIVNLKKSHLEPAQIGTWLGFNIDTTKMEFSVPKEKIIKLLHLLSIAVNSKSVSAKLISIIAGSLISMSIAIDSLTRLFTRQMYAFIESRINWYSSMDISEPLKKELLFWLVNLEKSNGFRIRANPTTTK